MTYDVITEWHNNCNEIGDLIFDTIITNKDKVYNTMIESVFSWSKTRWFVCAMSAVAVLAAAYVYRDFIYDVFNEKTSFAEEKPSFEESKPSFEDIEVSIEEGAALFPERKSSSAENKPLFVEKKSLCVGVEKVLFAEKKPSFAEKKASFVNRKISFTKREASSAEMKTSLKKLVKEDVLLNGNKKIFNWILDNFDPVYFDCCSFADDYCAQKTDCDSNFVISKCLSSRLAAVTHMF